MQKFKYVALNLQKKKFTGTFIADDVKQLTAELAKQNLYLISAKPVSDTVQNSFFSLSVGSSVKVSELTTFCRQFSIMINSGISILDTVGILRTQSFSSYFKRVLDAIYEDVKGGLLLSEAIKKHKKVFPNFFQSMLHVGEMSGKLDAVMVSLADYYEKDAAMKRRLKGAMAYPMMLLFMIIGIIMLMMMFVIPTFRDALSSLDVEMPAITMAVYNMSDFILQNWMYLLGGLMLLIGIFMLINRSTKGKIVLHTIYLRIPILRRVLISTVTSRFARGFGLLTASGLDVVDAMETICPVLGNKAVEKKFTAATEDVRHGMSLTMAFEAYKLFPAILTQMVAVGEKTGELDSVLMRSCTFFDDQVESSLNAFSSILQPLMLIIMGVTVAVMFIAIYSPMLSIMTGLGA